MLRVPPSLSLSLCVLGWCLSKDEQNGALHLARRKIKFSASAICSPLVVSALAFSCAQDVAPIAAISVATRLVVALDNNCNNSEFMRQFAPSVSASLAQVSGGLPLQPQNKSHFHPAVIALLFPLERTSCVPSELRAPRLFCRCAVCPAWHFLLLLYFAFFFYFPAFFFLSFLCCLAPLVHLKQYGFTKTKKAPCWVWSVPALPRTANKTRNCNSQNG